MKIVGPTIVEPWREQIEGAKTLKRLRELRDRLHHFRVLDPACGSRQLPLHRLPRAEAPGSPHLSSASHEFSSQAEPGQTRARASSRAQNFYGMDINPFAVELAKVTMMIARKLAIDELHITEHALPLDNLDANFIAADALIDARRPARATGPRPTSSSATRRSSAPSCSSPSAAPTTSTPCARAYPEVPGMADYCVYWFRKAHDHLPPCTADRSRRRPRRTRRHAEHPQQPVPRRRARSHRQDRHDRRSRGQPAWSGEANVHVSIANWVKTQDAALLPKTRRLWFKVEPSAGSQEAAQARQRPGQPRNTNSTVRECDCNQLGAVGSDRCRARPSPLACNTSRNVCFNGQMPGHEGFLLDASRSAAHARRAIRQSAK